LGGNSQTSLIITATLSCYNDRETLSTLRFGNRAKNIKNKPIANAERSAKELLAELEKVGKHQERLSQSIVIIQKKILTYFKSGDDDND
jgi:kinesin family protein 5